MAGVKMEVKQIRIKKGEKHYLFNGGNIKIDPEKHSKNMLTLVNCYLC